MKLDHCNRAACVQMIEALREKAQQAVRRREDEIAELKAQVALLREALEKHSAPYLGHDDYVREALEVTK